MKNLENIEKYNAYEKFYLNYTGHKEDYFRNKAEEKIYNLQKEIYEIDKKLLYKEYRSNPGPGYINAFGRFIKYCEKV